MLFAIVAALGCAEPGAVPVSLQWYSTEVECSNAAAVWEAPEDVVALQVRRREKNGWTYYVGGTVEDGGTLSVGCTDDVAILYAIAE